MFITFLFSIFFYSSIFSYNPDNPEIPPVPEKPEKSRYDNQHANDIYSQFGIGSNKRNWLGLAEHDKALFERQHECKYWSRKDYYTAIARLRCQISSFPIDVFWAFERGYTFFVNTESKYFYISFKDQENILNQINLYEYEAFRDTVSQFSGYESKVKALHELIHSNKEIEKRVTTNAHNAIAQECDKIESRRLFHEKRDREIKEEQARKEREEAARKKLEEEREKLRNTFYNSLNQITNDALLWNNSSDIARHYGLSNEHFGKRMAALNATQNSGAEYKQLEYTLEAPSIGLIGECNYNQNQFTTHYGNQLQQAVHQECIDVLDRTARLQTVDSLYIYRKDFMDCVDASREFNQIGLTHKATTINDFCFVLLDIGHAMAKGACLGVYYAAYDLATHPLHTGLCLVAGQYVLAYQACKLAYAVADIAITSYYDRLAGYEKLDAYLAPVDALLTQFEKGISAAQAAELATQVTVGWYAQGRMLKGLNSIYGKARMKAIEFIEKYPQAEPELFLATPEGMLLKAGKLSNEKTPFIDSHTNIPKREKSIPRMKTYEQARNKALELIGKVDPHTATPHVGKFGKLKGKIIGTDWHDGDVSFRIDYAPGKGPHINITDYRLGNGVKGNVYAVLFEGTESTVQSLIKHLNTRANLEMTKTIFMQTDNKYLSLILNAIENLNKNKRE